MWRWASACWPRCSTWCRRRRIKSKPKPAGQRSWWAPLDWLPPLDTLERIAHATLEFGFPCMTVGLVIGSVLAQETPLGAAYFLDPKIIASFAMWAIYVLLLLVRRTAGLRGPQGGVSLRRGLCGDDGGAGPPTCSATCTGTVPNELSRWSSSASTTRPRPSSCASASPSPARSCRRPRAPWPPCPAWRSA